MNILDLVHVMLVGLLLTLLVGVTYVGLTCAQDAQCRAIVDGNKTVIVIMKGEQLDNKR